MAGVAPLLYPGSAQALDPGEPGPHGAWLMDVAGSVVTAALVPLSSVRYDTITVELSPEKLDDVESVLAQAVRDHVEDATRDAERVRYLSLRLRLTGRTAGHRALTERIGVLARELQVTRGQTTAFVERVQVETRPVVDLRKLAEGSDPPAVLARLILALEAGGDEANRLVREAESRADEIRIARPYLQLEASGRAAVAGDEVPPAASVLQRQAVRLLDELLAQKAG